jgi:dipeptidase D
MIPSHFAREPKHIWEQFYHITQIPRPSKKEEKFRVYLRNFAKRFDLGIKEDQAGNVILYVAASVGREDEATIIIQNHLDMVCDKAVGIEHHFDLDPIKTQEVEGWIKAVGTTLGADNGIGCAAALAIVTSGISHPPLELLFTSDEETGLNGALGIDASLLSGSLMLNLDTEEWGSLYVGCAGGVDYELNKKVEYKTSRLIKHDAITVDLKVLGLVGGHSGVDIHLGRGNAIKILAGLLSTLKDKVEFEFVSFEGGRAHNIIPREAKCRIHLKKNLVAEVKSIVGDYYHKMVDALYKDDQEFQIELDELIFTDERRVPSDDFSMIVSTALSLPHGAFSYMWEFEEPLVRYSANLARFICTDQNLYFEVSARFTHSADITQVEPLIRAVSETHKFTLTRSEGYPSWTPDLKSALLEKMKQTFEKTFGEKPKVKAIHAGLECGILKERLNKKIDVVSFGPTIMGAHSPDERIEINSVSKFWQLLTETLGATY